MIIAIESSEQDTVGNIINRLTQTSIRIKAIPSTYDLLTGKVKISSLYGTPLLEILPDLTFTVSEGTTISGIRCGVSPDF